MRKTFHDFITNEWPHLVAQVSQNTWLLRAILGAILALAIATIVTG